MMYVADDEENRYGEQFDCEANVESQTLAQTPTNYSFVFFQNSP